MYVCTKCGQESGNITVGIDPRYATGRCRSCGKQRNFKLVHFPPPPSQGDENSDAAADSMESLADSKRRQVYELLSESGPLAEWQIERKLGWPGNTVRPRLWELEKAGRITKGPDKNFTPSGRSAWLYRVRA